MPKNSGSPLAVSLLTPSKRVKYLKRHVRTSVSGFLIAAMLLFTPSFAAGETDVYGDAKLHAIEQQIISLAEASEKDISYQEHQKLLDKVAGEIVGGLTDPNQLATLAIWANLNAHSNELDGKFINYNHVINTAYSSAVARIGQLPSSGSEAALWRVAHQVNIDGHVSEELCEAMELATKKKDFRFGDRVYTRFQDKVFDKTPMPPHRAMFRVAVCDELWKNWKSPVANSVDVIARATFVIDGDRQFTNIKVVPVYFGKSRDQASGLQFVDAARSALEHCALKLQLPDGIKKVRIEADFYGR